MRIHVFGSAAGGGVPQWNCDCRNCREARAGRLPCRLAAAVAVSADQQHWVVVNAGCDISRQLAAHKAFHPTSTRANPIGTLLLTDANIDHVAGVLEFRQADLFRVRSTALVRDTLCQTPMFAQFSRGSKEWLTFEVSGGETRIEVEAAAQLNVWAIPVCGLLPTYAGGQERLGATVAYVFEHHGARFVYAPIFLALQDHLRRECERADAVLLDGTCWADDEMIVLGLGTRTSRAMGHAPISGPAGSLQALNRLHAKHRYYTHINNSNPILDPASMPSRLLHQAGFDIAHDGLQIVLDEG